MSETETHKGKLVPMVLDGVMFEERAKDACRILGFKMDDEFQTTWLDLLEDEGYRKVHVDRKKQVIYEVHDEELDPYGFTEGTAKENGVYEYFISYYNGGASFDEVIESAIKKADKAKE